MSFFLHLRAGVVGTEVHIFDECFPVIPVPLLHETLVLVQERVYNTMTSKIQLCLFQLEQLTAFGIQETAWTSHKS